MKTEVTNSPEAAARFITSGGIVAFPTETVYGLGADVFDETAVAKIFAAKRRPGDNPLIAHVSDPAQIEQLASEVPQQAGILISAFFPGPLTLVLNRTEKVPLIATAGLETIGVRMPRGALAAEFLRRCATPVVAPSANLSGRPSPTTWQAVVEDLDGRIDCVLKGEATEIGLESTVVDCTGEVPVVLRSGAISFESLKEVVPNILGHQAAGAEVARSPGMRHRHYAPRAKVTLVSSPEEIADHNAAGYIGLQTPGRAFEWNAVCDSVEEYARRLFAFFRECDSAGARIIYCQAVEETGLGVALMDRLRRAAAR